MILPNHVLVVNRSERHRYRCGPNALIVKRLQAHVVMGMVAMQGMCESIEREKRVRHKESGNSSPFRSCRLTPSQPIGLCCRVRGDLSSDGSRSPISVLREESGTVAVNFCGCCNLAAQQGAQQKILWLGFAKRCFLANRK